ncbi:MAG TPA: OFA family MFS transporter [Cellulomonadaceae bacterium]|nr:OFA family MFS transporter [Cellulomonadaceae bacterium]
MPTSSPTLNRWSVLWGSVAILMCTGAIYAFSVFAGPLGAAHHWSPAQVMLAFTINGAVGPIPMILGGFIIDRGSSRLLVVIGGLMFAAGFILTGLATTTTALYLSYGLLAGLGQGFAYSACLNNTLKLFPDRRGQAAGIITGGMGAATVIAAPVANALISSYSVTTAFVVMGSVYAAVIVVGSLFIRQAPVGYSPEGWVRPASDGRAVNLDWAAMLKTPVFYMIFLMMGVGAFSGLMIAANASGIGKGMFALSAATAAVYVSIYSACNALGRVAWGAVSDRIGYTNALLLIFGVVAASMLVLVTVSSTVGFAVGIVGLGLCFGGVMGVFPALTMKNFGPRFQGINYGIMFTAYSVAAYFAPKLAADMGKAHNGDFTIAFEIAIGLAVVGALLTLVFTRVQKAHQDTLAAPARESVAVS